MTKQEILDYFALIDYAYNDSGRFESLSRMLDELLEERPEIVRCKDCEYAFFKEGLVAVGYIFCTKPGTERGQAVKPDDWFCADGSKREDERP